jgi:serine/threonine protein kinase
MADNFLGILFNIEELGAAYGLAAYRLLFQTADPSYFHGCYFSDGDVRCRLGDGDFEEKYCIGIESFTSGALFKIEAQVAQSAASGFAPPDSRFSFDERIKDHLVPAGRISAEGKLEGCENAWMQNAWNDLHSRQDKAEPAIEENLLYPATLINPPTPAESFPESKIATDEYRPGEVIGQDYLVRDVRKGGMGVVYIVEDLKSRRQNIHLRLALKTFQSRYLWNDEAIGRFEREAVVWIELGKHPNIVHAMLVQRVANRPYLWLEFVDGESLADRLARKRLEINEAISYGLQFSGGIRHAYENHGLIHRDIKPANILISRDNILKITDFGLSKLQAEFAGELATREGTGMSADEMETVSGMFVTAAGRCVGTPAYIAPEAISTSHAVDIRADIYSFGIVLYEMLTQQRPFSGANILRQHLDALPAPVRLLNPEVSVDLDRIVARCLEKEPGKRFQTFADLELALLRVQGASSALELPKREDVSIPLFGQWFMKGFTFMELAKYEEAIKCFQEVIALDPSQEEAHNNIGVCLGNLGRVEEAVDFTEKAVALKPEYPEAWSNLGGLYETLQRYDDGIRACRRAIDLKPRWAEAHSNLGANLASIGRLDEAISCFQRAIQEDASYWLAYLKMAHAYADRGALQDAVQALHTALSINPREADLLAGLAACLTDLNEREEASKYLQLALQANPEHPLALRVEEALKQ